MIIKENEGKDYTVAVSLVTLNGAMATEYYDVYADDEESAIVQAKMSAEEDLSVEDVEEIRNNIYRVDLSLNGSTVSYRISANDEEEACELVIEQAHWDLEAEIVTE